MSDSDQCTFETQLGPSFFAEVQAQIHHLAKILHAECDRLENFGRLLPEPGPEFDPMAELHAAMDCVRRELLADAVETLHLVATLSEDQLRERFEERRTWLVAAA